MNKLVCLAVYSGNGGYEYVDCKRKRVSKHSHYDRNNDYDSKCECGSTNYTTGSKN